MNIPKYELFVNTQKNLNGSAIALSVWHKKKSFHVSMTFQENFSNRTWKFFSF